ncbi:putative phage abortive infection protein [Fulvivirga ulvae]|uniref:putative phage abortive infection protein n=1 Tax=Fulvivirga ulvae TaxID=2904245 RepID=UPI00351E4CD3
MKTVRAQLSNHEQTLIYFNSFFNAGEIWWEEKHHNPKKLLKNERGRNLSYFLDYRIIKNLPFNLTRFGPDPEIEFVSRLKKRNINDQEIEKEKKDLFEWIGG